MGKAPFKFVGQTVSKFQAAQGEPIKAGSCCDVCPAAIMNVYWIRSADGHTFKVGCECVYQTGDLKLGRSVKQAAAKANTKKRHAKEAEKLAELDALMADVKVLAALAAAPHPKSWADSSLLGWCEWMLAHAGTTGKLKVLKAMKAVAS